MKKYIFLLCITLFLIVFIGNLKPNTEVFDAEIPTITQDIITVTEELENFDDTLFIAKNLDGYVAIFVPNNLEPLLKTDIYVKTLPIKDQNLLDIGINLNSSYTLEEFIENYSS